MWPSRSTSEPNQALVASLRRHQASLKMAFRLYCLIDSKDDDVDDMSKGQFQNFVRDAQICGDIGDGAAGDYTAPLEPAGTGDL